MGAHRDGFAGEIKTRRAVVRGYVVSLVTGFPEQCPAVLERKQRGGQGVLGDGDGIGGVRAADDDAPIPDALGHPPRNRSGGIEDRLQLGRGVEHRIVHERRIPAGQQKLHIAHDVTAVLQRLSSHGRGNKIDHLRDGLPLLRPISHLEGRFIQNKKCFESLQFEPAPMGRLKHTRWKFARRLFVRHISIVLRRVPNKAASADTPLVGVVVDGASGYGRQILRGVLAHANLQRRWRLHEELRPRQESLDYWPQCDGAIYAGGGGNIFEHVRQRSTHTIACSGAADPHLTPVVSLDDLAVGELAAQHLIDCRLEQFAFYGNVPPGELHIGQPRLAGFRRGLERRGYVCTESPVVYPRSIDRLTHAHWPALIDWLRGLPKPVGIMASEDGVAHDLAAACLEAQIAVPDQVAIIGVDNDDLLCEGGWPPLSSIDSDFARIGFQAASLLDRLLLGEELAADQRVIRLPPIGVVQRVSTSVLAVKDPALAEAVRFIREHACDPCSVEDVLREVTVGRRWLERQFVAQLGRTPHEEIVRVRIENAKRLLLRPEFGVVHVAERCGFSKVQFMRAFRQLMGTTPAAYRRQILRGEGRNTP